MLDDIDAAFAEFLGEPEPTPSEPALAIADPRERFAALNAAVCQLEQTLTVVKNRLRERYETHMKDLWHKVKGNRKFALSTAETSFPDVVKEQIALARGKLDAYRLGHYKATDLLADAVRRTADEITVAPSEVAWYFADYYPSAFSTQPGKEHYAKVRAELTAADVRAKNVRAEARTHESGGSNYYAVYVYAAEADLPIVRAKSGAALADLVRLSWKLGANPRVYWPTLPHDYEAAHGFDFFGNDLNDPNPAQNSEPPANPSGTLFEEPEPL